jgi:hypothetical protein
MIDNLIPPSFDLISLLHNPYLPQPNLALGKAFQFHNFAKQHMLIPLSLPTTELIHDQIFF